MLFASGQFSDLWDCCFDLPPISSLFFKRRIYLSLCSSMLEIVRYHFLCLWPVGTGLLSQQPQKYQVLLSGTESLTVAAGHTSLSVETAGSPKVNWTPIHDARPWCSVAKKSMFTTASLQICDNPCETLHHPTPTPTTSTSFGDTLSDHAALLSP